MLASRETLRLIVPGPCHRKAGSYEDMKIVIRYENIGLFSGGDQTPGLKINTVTY